MSERVGFVCDGRDVDLDVEPGESLLVVLRERLGLISVKDGCAPQGQCGCCTVLVDGDPRVACVTPVARVAGRTVTTVDGLDSDTRDALVRGFLATGGSQCGFCTPGIVVRCAALLAKGKSDPAHVDRLSRLPDFRFVLPTVLFHHERWDGRGYPFGRRARAIPLEARVLAVADAFDAMTSPRPYGPPVSRAQAFAEIGRCAGSQFDPAVADLFIALGTGLAAQPLAADG